MPIKVLEQYALAMPRLQAQETLQMYHASALASGNMKREQVRKALRELQSAANGVEHKRMSSVYRPKNKAEYDALMARAGMING